MFAFSPLPCNSALRSDPDLDFREHQQCSFIPTQQNVQPLNSPSVVPLWESLSLQHPGCAHIICDEITFINSLSAVLSSMLQLSAPVLQGALL